MFTPGFATTGNSARWTWKESWARLFVSLTLWICGILGYYGSTKMVLGPSSSRQLGVSPVFAKRVQVRDEAKKGVLVYGFDERPELSLETNWTVSKCLVVGSYSQQGFSLWLNKGSGIRMRWEAPTASLNNLQIVIIKGERDLETFLPNASASMEDLSSSSQMGSKRADYVVPEDDKFYVSVVNTNPRNIVMTINLNVSSKVHDTTKASHVCSTIDGSCSLKVHFPSTRFVVLTTPNNVKSQFLAFPFLAQTMSIYVQADLGDWNIELSFVSRMITYVAILGSVMIVIFLILKYFGACNGENGEEAHRSSTAITTTNRVSVSERTDESESDPLIPDKSSKLTYGTGEEDLEGGSSSSSSDELYDGKICVICYDEPRNCFFVPCGHCATCYDCALRIMEGENRVCPICRRLIHKLRKLIEKQKIMLSHELK
ncbi:hypothetical protein V2J09_023853 [Rumex salicifolius]